MAISPKLASLNADRVAQFDQQASLPAVALFAGDVYLGLDARSLHNEQLAFAQEHLRILSGLYGLLRPMDAIRPYRLEMGSRLKIGIKASLYEFWGKAIAQSLSEERKLKGYGCVLNLASQEYARAVDSLSDQDKPIDVRFLEIKDNQARTLSFFAKRARGRMARYIIENKITNCDDTKSFDWDQYKFDPHLSRPHEYVFTRPQPEPLANKSASAS